MPVPGTAWPPRPQAGFCRIIVRLLSNAVASRADDVRDLLQRLTFIHLATYLLVGGLGLLIVPELTLRLLLSNGSYGDVLPRLVGVFMIALGGTVLEFVR